MQGMSTRMTGAADGARTRDPQLGKLLLYQLSYCRLELASAVPEKRPSVTLIDASRRDRTLTRRKLAK